MKTYSFRFMVMILVLLPAFAFGQVKGAVVYVEGNDFLVVRDGLQDRIKDPIGYELKSGDLLQTGKRTVVEIVLKDVGARIRIAENTTFRLKSLQGQGSSELELIYGRVRSKVEKLAGGQQMQVQSASAVAGVRGTDFSYDYVVSESSGQQISRVACFEGSVEVVTMRSVLSDKAKAEGLEKVPETVLLSPGLMVSIGAEQRKTPLKAEPVSEEVKAFWSKPMEPYSDTIPAARALAPEIAGQGPESGNESSQNRDEAGRKAVEDLLKAKKVIKAKNEISGAGLFMSFLSAAGALTSMVMQSTGDTSPEVTMIVSGVTIGCAAGGAALILVSISTNP